MKDHDGCTNKNEEIQDRKSYRWMVRYNCRNRVDSRMEKIFPSNDIRQPLGDFSARFHRNYTLGKLEKEKPVRENLLTDCFFVVPGARIELAQPQVPRDFKSLASTSSAIRAQAAW